MFDTLLLRSTPTCQPSRPAGRVGQTLALLAGSALLAVLAVVPHHRAVPGVQADFAGGPSPITLVLAQGGDLPALQATAETLRARLLTVPGVGAVWLRGLQTAGLEVQYAPAHLARLGVREAELEAAVPMQGAATVRGHLPVRLDAAGQGPTAIADLPVHAGRHILRLGDLAAVARMPLPAPVSTLQREGRPAVDLVVTPAPGAAAPELGRQMADSLAGIVLPPGVQMR